VLTDLMQEQRPHRKQSGQPDQQPGAEHQREFDVFAGFTHVDLAPFYLTIYSTIIAKVFLLGKLLQILHILKT
jgi:hypothetical protein